MYVIRLETMDGWTNIGYVMGEETINEAFEKARDFAKYFGLVCEVANERTNEVIRCFTLADWE